MCSDFYDSHKSPGEDLFIWRASRLSKLPNDLHGHLEIYLLEGR